MFVSSCKCCCGVVEVHPVMFLRALFWVVCKVFMFFLDKEGYHTGEA